MNTDLSTCCDSPNWRVKPKTLRPQRVTDVGLLVLRGEAECGECGAKATVDVTLSDAQFASAVDALVEVADDCLVECDADVLSFEANDDCRTCGGVGGGSDPATRCGTCHGTGTR